MYCMCKKKCPDGTEYVQNYCRFVFLLNFQCIWSIIFNEIKDGAVRNNFTSKCNDPLMNKYNKMHLQICMEEWDLQIVLDEEQAIRCLVKYAFKPDHSSHHMNDLMQSTCSSRWCPLRSHSLVCSDNNFFNRRNSTTLRWSVNPGIPTTVNLQLTGIPLTVKSPLNRNY